MKRGDLRPPLQVTLPGATDWGSVLSAQCRMRGATVGVVFQMAVDPATPGVVTHQWLTGETNIAGVYDLEVEVFWQDGRSQTWPSTGFWQLEIAVDIDSATLPSIVVPSESITPLAYAGYPTDGDSVVWDGVTGVFRVGGGLADRLPLALESGRLKVSDVAALAKLEEVRAAVIATGAPDNTAVLTALEAVRQAVLGATDETLIAKLPAALESGRLPVADSTVTAALETLRLAVVAASDEALITELVARLPTSEGGRLPVRNAHRDDIVVPPSTIASSGGTVSAATQNADLVTFRLEAGSAVTVSSNFEISLDGGSTWDTLIVTKADAVSGPTSAANYTAVAVADTYVASLPAGTTNVRLRAVTWSAGTLTVRVFLGFSPMPPIVAIGGGSVAVSGAVTLTGSTNTVALLGSGNRIGHVTTATTSYVETTIAATLAGNATGTGTIRDLLGQAGAVGGTNIGSATSGRFQALASADQPFVLGIEEEDSGTFTTATSVAGEVTASVLGTGGRYHAMIDVPIIERCVRAYVRNTSATAMTSLRVRSAARGLG